MNLEEWDYIWWNIDDVQKFILHKLIVQDI